MKKLLSLPKTRYSSSQIIRWLWHAWRGNRVQATINASIGLLLVAVSLAEVWAVQHAIDVAAGNTAGDIYWSVGVLGFLFLCDFALNISGIWVRNILGIRAQNRMQQLMLNRILRSEWQGREKFHSGDVLNRLEFDVVNVVNFLTETIPNTLSVIALFAGAFCYLFAMDAVLALVTVAIIPVFILLSKIYIRQMRRLTSEVRTEDSHVQSTLQETIQHRMLIKTLEREGSMVNRLENTQRVLRHKVVRRTKFSVFSQLVLNFGFALGYLIAFLWAALRMSAHSLTFGGMTAFLQLVNRIQSPARDLTKLVPAFVSVLTAAERLMELEESPLEQQGESVELKGPCGIRLRHVTYTYEGDDKPVLRGLDFDFRPGSCTAVLGETGAGKTTLVRLLLALIRPQQGRVEIYNRRSSHQLSPLTRVNFVYVPQGNTLLSGTIRDNLRLGRLSATDEEMGEALRMSCAEFVFDLPDGLDTFCGEGGAGLSEGQAQRIAIARALLRHGSVMVFDEATSALDPETEKQLLYNLLSSHDRTIIFITHRPAVKEYCDQTLTIDRITKQTE
ncbi:MAG: ABC transporter ATP-binding protein [Prevotella sp.]|nr:ABC transporter ATP-binding protein [Prevotella sp.]